MGTRQYRHYSDEDVIKFSKEVKSMAGLLKKLGLKDSGGNYANMRKNLPYTIPDKIVEGAISGEKP